MANETQLLKLDLDTKDFQTKAEQAGQAIKNVGDPSALEGLQSNIKETGKILGVLATVGIAAKAALDLTLEAESIRSVNQQFEVLTRNAGLAGDQLKNALMQAADGLVDDTDLLKAANEQVVRLGLNANKLPEIFALARDVTRAFGGDLLTNFDKLSTAIANGNARSLRQLGLVIDNDKALKDYAKSLGVTVDALSEQEQKTAILEATLNRGKVAFQGVDDSIRETTLLWERLKVSLQGIAETATLAFNRLAGPVIKAELKGLSAIAADVSRFFKDKFGEGPEQAAAHMERLQEKLNEYGAKVIDAKAEMEALEKQYGANAKSMSEYNDALIDASVYEKKLSEIRAEIGSTPKAQEAVQVQGVEIAAVTVDKEAAEKRLAVASRFEADLLNLRSNRINQELQMATSVEEVEKLQAERKRVLLEQLLASEQQITAQIQQGKLTERQADEMLKEVRMTNAVEIRKLEQKHEAERLQALENLAAVTARTSAGFANGFKAAAATASKDVGNFAKMGQQAFSIFQASATQAFLDLGSGSKKGSEVLKSFFLGALADMAQAQGTLMLAMITNPAAMAAGAGLLVLAGYLRSKAGAGGAGGGGDILLGGAESGGAGIGASPSGGMVSAEDRPQMEETRKKREVQLIVQGNYFETEQTKRTLMEMIRSETDATGFSYTQIGQGL